MADAIDELQRLIDEYLCSERLFTLLEAGCGSMSKVKLPSNVRITGIDISEKQLGRNAVLHEKILGDVHTYPLPEGAFDVIICWDVLEHLVDPRKALINFVKTCKPNGIIILAFPNLFSLKGLLTKIMPYRVHVWYYKYLLGIKDAGREDQPPFPTKLRLSMTYPAIGRFARSQNARVEFFMFRESRDMKYVREKFMLMNILMRASSAISRLLTFGKINAMNSDCIMVLRVSKA